MVQILSMAFLGLNLLFWGILSIYIHYNAWMMWLAWKHRKSRSLPAANASLQDVFVTVQLPVYNEPDVVARLLRAVGQLDYPADKFEIQLLDDSTDRTPAIAQKAIQALREKGLTVEHIRRQDRTGYKAGALKAGLETARGEFIVILDADFVPEPSMIKQMLPWFQDPAVGMVQGRWGLYTRPRCTVERCTAYWMQRHFDIEQFARSRSDHFFHFNGSGGMWRRTAIEDAGGWSADTVCEDLDLSFRAWSQKWRFIYDDSIVVPADQPPDMQALRIQQGRWSQGTFQVLHKVMSQLTRHNRATRLMTFLHLTGYLFPVLLLWIGLVSGLAAWAAHQWPVLGFWAVEFPALTFVAGMVVQLAFRTTTEGWLQGRTEMEATIVGLGLSPHIFRNMLSGLRHAGGEFKRTPKTRNTQNQFTTSTLIDLTIATILVTNILVAIQYEIWLAIPVPLLAATGIYHSAITAAIPGLLASGKA